MDFSGRWNNTKNSLLELKQEGSALTGTFDSGVSDNGKEIKAPVVGWVNGDRITFAATYKEFGTVVAWVGQATGEPGNPMIDAHYLHETDVAEGNEFEELWASTRTGSDQFRRISEAVIPKEDETKGGG
ncbi:avidin/streptavidin family protein [Paracoccus chinensis]|uniref:avidin/streptavidin family protein n=1 Tax=Paracoccus chinensis TaxID=525640 RepID=UPI000B88FEB8|nr:avidin/streptavidin family protein [Paracoccus chinensis]